MMYRLRPYLGDASARELRARMDDVLRNMLTFTPEGKVGALAPDLGGVMWAQKMTDLQVECGRREADIKQLGSVMSDLPFQNAALELIRENPEAGRYVGRSGVLCKFGERRWMTELINFGRLRLAPASYYRGSDHNAARQDDELALPVYVSPYDYDLGLLSPKILELCPVRNWHRLSVRKPTDHYLYCMAVSFDLRYFFDFAADKRIAESCVMIRDYDAFTDRLKKAAAEALPGFEVMFDSVRYVDPYLLVHTFPSAPDIYFFKSFRFLYQREHRLVAVPTEPVLANLEPVNLELGNLREFAELIEMRSPTAGSLEPQSDDAT